jgi:DNA-binding MarR family transcriptional regulator
MPPATEHGARGFWYAARPSTPPTPVDVLDALRGYRAAERAMRRRARGSMGVGETDLLAIRQLLEAQQLGRTVTAKDLARRLGISSASTTVLVDRLVRSGHARRETHPTDRRAVVVVATPQAGADVREHLGRMHERMLTVTESLDPEALRSVHAYLEAMRAVMEDAEPG